jgi:hypothetical protein
VEAMRWVRGLVPLAAIALVGAGARPPVSAAVPPPWVPPPCADAAPPGTGVPSWYRLDAVLDAAGTLSGQRLVLAVAGEAERTMSLPAESFASGPTAGAVLVGQDDGSRSRLTLVDVDRGCATDVGEDAAVIRSALLEPDGSAIWEHRVDRTTRSDLGVWRRPVDGTAPVRLVAPVPADRRYGRTFVTELRFAPDGRVAISSCGEVACRTRLVDPGSGRTTTIGPTGPVVGVTPEGAVVAHARCPALPCAVIAFRPGGGEQMLVPAAGPAALAGNRLVFEGPRGASSILDLGSGTVRRLAADDAVPLGDGSAARAGADHRAGSVLLAPGGRIGPEVLVLAAEAVDAAPLGEALR